MNYYVNLPNITIFKEELKRLTNNTNIISNLKLFYCKMGNKNLSLINEINNSIFLNTSFKSTNLENIKFNNVTFYSGLKYTVMLEKKKFNIKNLYSGSVNNRESTILFDEAKFKNNEFNNCKFLGKFIDKAKINNLKFKKCIFESSKEIEFSNLKKNNVKDTNGIIHTFILHEYDNNNHKVIEKSEKLLCSILFDDCTFKDTAISFFIENSIDEISLHFKNTVFNNIVFYGLIDKILFDNCIFNNCKFINNKCLNVTFNECEFIECNFRAVNFSFKSNKNLTYIKNSKIVNCFFNGCIFNNYFTNYFYNINNLIFDNTSFVNTTIAYCNLVMFKFNIKPDHSNKMIMKNNRFVCNDLFGTNFSYCDLEGSSFAATVNCGEKINWFGNVFIKLPKLSDTKQNIIFQLSKNNSISDDKKQLLLNNNPIKDSEDHVFKKIIQYFSLQESTALMFENQVENKLNILYITEEQYADIINVDIKDLLFNDDVNIQDAKNKFNSYHDYYNVLLNCNNFYLLLVPPTNFHNANIKTCNFQQLEGFTGFDFTKVSQIKDGDRMRPDLNATNFTGCIMNYANFQYANIIGTVFQASDITRANFKNTKFNDNTDFENANFEEAINTDHINIGNLRQGANETHARAQVIIDNYKNLLDFFIASENYSVKTRDDIIISVDYHSIIPNLINNINNNINLDNKEKNVIKLYFTSYIPHLIFEYLNFDNSNQKDKKLHDKIKENFKVCVDDTFVDLLIKRHTNSVDGKTIAWSWFEITYASTKFLLKQTETYIYTFIQYYFNEVFNAHGPGSKSCPKGMIERLVTIHSQTAEFYNATFMDVDPNNSNLIQQLSKYDSEREDDPSFKGDSFINENYIKNYDSEKFKFNKLINLTKPNSNLPEKKDDDLGFTIDYSLSPANREEADKILKMLCKSDEKKGNPVDTLDKLCIQYSMALLYVILSNHKYKDKPILLNNLHPDLKKNLEFQFNKILLELKNYIQKNEIPAFRESVIYLYGTEKSDIKSEDIKDYLTEGGSKSKSSKKTKTQTIKKSQLLKNKTSLTNKNKLFIKDSKIIISENKIEDFIKAREKDIVDKYLQLSYKEIQSKLQLKVDKLSDNQDKSKIISLKDDLMFNYIKVPKLQTSILYKVYKNIILKQFKLVKIFNKFNVFKSSSNIDKQIQAISKLDINNLLKQELDKENLDKNMINKQKVKSKTNITPKIKSNTTNVLNTTLKKKISRRSSPIDIMNTLQDLNN